MSESLPIFLPSPALDPVPRMLPPVFRVVSLVRLPLPDGVRNEATLYHDEASLRVVWMARHVDTKITAGDLVAIRWLGKPTAVEGAVRISRLVHLERADASANLFHTVLPAWVKDRTLVARGSALWEGLSRPFQHLLNAIFWDGKRFNRFLTGPSSLNGHHGEVSGNFRHAVEVAESCLHLANGSDRICLPLLVTAALLHDAGKADEYQLDANHQGLVMSPRGALVGHRHTILEWIAVARFSQRVIIPENYYLGLLHALSAAKGVEWLGIRAPLSAEAAILSAADRLSGHVELVSKSHPDASGFGAYHPHLKGRPFVLAELEDI